MKKILMLSLLMACAVQAQVMVRGKGNDWMLITSDPPNCSNFTLTSSTTASITGAYTLPCHWDAVTYVRWFVTEDAAIAWANDTQSPMAGLYHVDHETEIKSSEYDIPVKQPDKVEHRKKYTKAK